MSNVKIFQSESSSAFDNGKTKYFKNEDTKRPSYKNVPYTDKNFFTLMKYERLRLVTFLLHCHRWPKMNIISPTELAKAGFFYLHDDAVQCAFCRVIVKKWEPGDVAMQEHKKHDPNCPFVLGEYVGNVTLELDPEINSENGCLKQNQNQEKCKIKYNTSSVPRYPLFNTVENRHFTFTHDDWKGQIDKKLLVNAGFFFTGKQDYTKCFHCGGLLFDWKSDDNPMEEHALFFPKCHFLLSLKGEAYLEFVNFKKELIQLRVDSPKSNSKHNDLDLLKSFTFDLFVKIKDKVPKIFVKLIKQNSMNSELDYYQQYSHKNSLFFDCQKILNYIHDDDTNNSTSSSSSSNSQVQDLPNSIVNLSLFSSDESNSTDSDYSSDNCSVNDEQSKNVSNQAKSIFSCIICYDKKIQVVFEPCGHQVACLNCAEKLFNCPICRTLINKKIRTFFAHEV